MWHVLRVVGWPHLSGAPPRVRCSVHSFIARLGLLSCASCYFDEIFFVIYYTLLSFVEYRTYPSFGTCRQRQARRIQRLLRGSGTRPCSHRSSLIPTSAPRSQRAHAKEMGCGLRSFAEPTRPFWGYGISFRATSPATLFRTTLGER